MSKENLKFECYHQDRLKKDIKIGEANLNLKLILKSPVRKTSQSYARVLDMYLPIDDVD